MDKKNVNRVMRLSKIMNSIPKPITFGTQTATAEGVIAYAHDVAVLQNTLKAYFFHLATEINWKHTDEWEEAKIEMDFVEPEKILDAIEVWLVQREKNDWKISKNLDFSDKIDYE